MRDEHQTHEPYVLVTPARNEREFIELTIKSVISQTVKPRLWVIVSDRSDDGTDEIVSSYARIYSFIRLVRSDRPSERNAAAKVHAINIGIEALGAIEYAYIGNLDADVSFGETYFETLLRYLEEDERLGIVGGRIFQVDKSGDALEQKSSEESVAGAIQFFRKECFDQIGGYRAIPGGMEDGIAEITARYHGWTTRSFKGLPVFHHRELGTVGRSIFHARFNNGLTEYIVGYGLAYHVARALSRVFEKPYVLGSVLLCSGYAWGMLSRMPKAVPDDLIRFIRREQTARLYGLIHGRSR